MSLACVDAVGGNLYFIDTAKREEYPDEILRRILGGLLHDISYRVCDGSMEGDALDLHAGEIDSNELSRFERGFHRTLHSRAYWPLLSTLPRLELDALPRAKPGPATAMRPSTRPLKSRHVKASS